MNKFERYWKLSEMEERYNSSSAGIRTLASAWLLGALGAVGWLISTYDGTAWPLPLGVLIIVLMSLGNAGIVTLWVMDQLVFHRLLDSVFLVGLKMEFDDPEIPPIRSMMMKSQEGLGAHIWERFFYLAPLCAFALISLLVIISGFRELFSSNGTLFGADLYLYASLILFVYQLAAAMWMFAKFPSMSLETRASYFDKPEFTSVFAKSRFETTISKFRTSDVRMATETGRSPLEPERSQSSF